jgi:hypothetical protein
VVEASVISTRKGDHELARMMNSVDDRDTLAEKESRREHEGFVAHEGRALVRLEMRR